ncbi:Snapc3, partial [Symbiodinium natans]
MPFFLLNPATGPTATGARQCLPLLALRALLQVCIAIAIIVTQPMLAEPHVVLQLVGMGLSFCYFPLDIWMSCTYIRNNTNEDDDDDRVGPAVCTLFVCLPFHALNGSLLVVSFIVASGADLVASDYVVLVLGCMWIFPGLLLLIVSCLQWLVQGMRRFCDAVAPAQAPRK